MRAATIRDRPVFTLSRDSGTSATSSTSLAPISASVIIRHVPPIRISLGRNRDLYAILRLSGTQ